MDKQQQKSWVVRITASVRQITLDVNNKDHCNEIPLFSSSSDPTFLPQRVTF